MFSTLLAHTVDGGGDTSAPALSEMIAFGINVIQFILGWDLRDFVDG